MEDLLFKLSAAGIFVCFPVVVGFFVWKLQTGNEDGVIEYNGLRIDLAALTNIFFDFVLYFCDSSDYARMLDDIKFLKGENVW